MMSLSCEQHTPQVGPINVLHIEELQFISKIINCDSLLSQQPFYVGHKLLPQKSLRCFPSNWTHQNSSNQITTTHQKKFEGDRWKNILHANATWLMQVFISEASVALNISKSHINIISLRIGSLYVTFHVTHDENITQEELDERIEQFPFREMWQLYHEQDAPADGLDAAIKEIEELKSQVSYKEECLHRAVMQSDDKIKTLHEQLRELENKLQEEKQTREKELLNLLTDREEEVTKISAEFREIAEQNRQLIEALKREKTRSEKSAQRQSDLIAAIIQENKKEKEAKEREHKEEIEMKDYIIENLKEQLRYHHNDNESGNESDSNILSEHFPQSKEADDCVNAKELSEEGTFTLSHTEERKE